MCVFNIKNIFSSLLRTHIKKLYLKSVYLLGDKLEALQQLIDIAEEEEAEEKAIGNSEGI